MIDTELVPTGSKKHRSDDIEMNAETSGDEPMTMKDLAAVVDTFHAFIIPDDIFLISSAVLLIEMLLLFICFNYSEPNITDADQYALMLACIYAAIAAVTEVFDDLVTVIIGLKCVLFLQKSGQQANRRRLILGFFQMINMGLMIFIMTIIVPLQGGPVDIVLNSTAFLAIMQLDKYVLKYMGFTYVHDPWMEKLTGKMEEIALRRRKRAVLVLILVMYSCMCGVIYKYSSSDAGTGVKVANS